MSASWISAVVAAVVAAGLLVVFIWRDGQVRGQQAAILERLTKLAEDHEQRLRDLERLRAAERLARRR